MPTKGLHGVDVAAETVHEVPRSTTWQTCIISLSGDLAHPSDIGEDGMVIEMLYNFQKSTL